MESSIGMAPPPGSMVAGMEPPPAQLSPGATHLPMAATTAGATTVYHANYVRNSRAIGVLWGIFTICFAIIAVVVFINPQWIGDTLDSPGTGHFGLWRHCHSYSGGGGGGAGSSGEPAEELRCRGELTDFSTLINGSFKASAVFVGLSALFILLCILLMLLFFFLSASTVYSICCWFQAFSALCMCIGCIIYPSGWDDNTVKSVCGPDTTRYEIGECEIRWAYILAIIGIFDALILAVLAFVLATKHVKLLPEPVPTIIQPAHGAASNYRPGDHISVGYVDAHTLSRGEINHGYHPPLDAVSSISKKSLNLQPVMSMPGGGGPVAIPPPHLMPPPLGPGPPHDQTDRFSEYSHGTARSKLSRGAAGAGGHNYASSVQDFQL